MEDHGCNNEICKKICDLLEKSMRENKTASIRWQVDLDIYTFLIEMDRNHSRITRNMDYYDPLKKQLDENNRLLKAKLREIGNRAMEARTADPEPPPNVTET